jgi:uncharacterized protein
MKGMKYYLKIIGIDLSGPANHKDTVMSVFQLTDGLLTFEKVVDHASDESILTAIQSISSKERIVIGLDAPLSYQDGGGDRPQDKSIRQFIKGCGLIGSSIMPPTLTKMVYLTLRGMGLTRRIMQLEHAENIRIVEVHPGAAIGTRIGSKELYHALQYKKEIASRMVIFDWFQIIGMRDIPNEFVETSHLIDSCGAVLAAWHWCDETKQPTWHWKEKTDEHPFEFCC